MKTEYEQLLRSNWQQYQPVGRTEELEVERITVCWLRLGLACRYERSARNTSTDGTPSREVEAICKKVNEESRSTGFALTALTDQVKRFGVPPDLQEAFAAKAGSKVLWGFFQRYAKDILQELDFPKYANAQDVSVEASQLLAHKIPFSQDYEKALAIQTLKQASIHFDSVDWFTKAILARVTVDAELMPNPEALDWILRYEAAAERSLERAINRLERLQRRRKNEPVSPPLNLHLTA